MKKFVTNILLVWGAAFITYTMLDTIGIDDMRLEYVLIGLVMYLAHSLTTRYIVNGLFRRIDRIKDDYQEIRSQARANAVMKAFENLE